MRQYCPPYAYLQALRHGAELIDEIRVGEGPLSRSLFDTFNKDRARPYKAWINGLGQVARATSTLEDFACEVALSLQ